ncbi:SH3 domain-containing protein [Streptomyces sp. NPDC057555]|uniref:SH3 domain-containing protein n=1 Tax=Streptomyces sp. NPDC057555 TaxID=3346166 RepID=UPI0036D124E4
MTQLSQFRRGAAVLASVGLLCGVLGSGTATAASPAHAPRVGDSGHGHGAYKGRIIARTGLVIRTGPGTEHPAMTTLPYGEVITLVCKVNGQNIHGNPRWYKLDWRRDSFASARYIEPIGAAPEWCRDKGD